MAVQDLPNSTKAPELDDSNATSTLIADSQWTGEDLSVGSGVTIDMVGLYLSYLVAIDFMPRPEHGKGKPLPVLWLHENARETRKGAGGRAAK